MQKSVLSRAIVVALVLMSLSFAGIAYYHYNTNAATDYLCKDNSGTLLCDPYDSYELYKMNVSSDHESFFPIKRHFISMPVIHISKLYLFYKYSHMYGSKMSLGNEQGFKQDSKDFRSELSSIEASTKYYESRYIEEALAFAGKWTLLLPLSLITLLCIAFGIKNYILHGRIKAAR